MIKKEACSFKCQTRSKHVFITKSTVAIRRISLKLLDRLFTVTPNRVEFSEKRWQKVVRAMKVAKIVIATK